MFGKTITKTAAIATSALIPLVLATASASPSAAPFRAGRARPDLCQSTIDIQLADRLRQAIDPIVEEDLRRSGAPGAGIVIVRGDCVLYKKGYGVSDLTTGAHVSTTFTAWPVASISKVFTAALAMQLVAEGKLRLDRDVNDELTSLRIPSGGYGPVTLRNLLDHTAAFDELPGRQFDGGSPENLSTFLSTRLSRYRAPGLRTAYSTYGIALAGALVQDRTGLSYDDALHRYLLQPAGMSSTRVMRRLGDEAGVATPYELEDGQAKRIPYEWYVTTPTTSVVSTIDDMSKLLRIFLNDGRLEGRQILPKGVAAQMLTQQATNHPALTGWGLGFQLDRDGDLILAEHGGDIGGFSALFSLIPSQKIGLFVVNHGEGGDLRFKVKRALLGVINPHKLFVVPAANAASAPALSQAYAGRYLSGLACRSCEHRESDIFTVRVDSDGSLNLWGRRWIMRQRDLFVRDDGGALLGFTRDSSGKVDGVTGGSYRTADRIGAS